VAARHGSFIEAAEELSVTPGAISRHIKLLEEFLDTALFDRRSNGVVLTRDGKRYATKTTLALHDLIEATREIKKQRERRRLALSTLPIFSEKWLNQRLPTFQRSNKEVDFQLEFHDGMSVHIREDIDACVYYSNRRRLSGDITFLFGEQLVPICSPDFFRKLPADPTADHIARLPRLHDKFWSDDWQEWARAAGAAEADFTRGMRFALYSGVVQTACAGMGIAIGHSAMIGDELADGRLIALKQFAVRSPKSYYLVIPSIKVSKPMMRKLKDWIQAEARSDKRVIIEEL
jgi:LysR family glycine cleavage system transcriptional activator